jgi:predicted ATPase
MLMLLGSMSKDILQPLSELIISTGTSRFLEMIAALSESEKNSIFIFD